MRRRPPRSTRPIAPRSWRSRDRGRSASGPRPSSTHQSGRAQKVLDAYRPALTLKGDPAPARPSSSGSARPATAGRPGRRGRARPRGAQRQVPRDPARRDPRPEPGLRVAVRQLHRGDGRRPRPLRPDRQRDGHRRDAPPPGGQGGRPAPHRDRGDGGLGPVADARGHREGPDPARPRRPDRVPGEDRTAAEELPGQPSRGRSSQSPTGRSSCRAADAEIYGETLVFEPHYGNLGYWTSADDRAAWSFEVAQPGKYRSGSTGPAPTTPPATCWRSWAGHGQIHFAGRAAPAPGTIIGVKAIGELELGGDTTGWMSAPRPRRGTRSCDLRRIELRPISPGPEVEPR